MSPTITTEWSHDGWTMLVINGFQFVDEALRIWPVPAGFITDGASIPTVLWSVVGSPFTGQYRIAAVLHDAAYSTLGVDRLDADRMLFEAARTFGCAWWKAKLIYAGVRLGGGQPYLAAQDAAFERSRA